MLDFIESDAIEDKEKPKMRENIKKAFETVKTDKISKNELNRLLKKFGIPTALERAKEYDRT